MSTIPTVKVTVARKRKDGTIVGFEPMILTRVPSVGEHIASVAGRGDGDNDKYNYRVDSVVHFNLDHGVGSRGEVAEVKATEIDLEPDFAPSR